MKIISKIILVTLMFAVASCSFKNFKRDEKPRIRLVDAEGKPHQVAMKTPALNMQALQEQGNLSEEKIISQKENPKDREVILSKNKYSNGSYDQPNQELQSTLQMQQNPQMQNKVARQNQEYMEGQDIAGVENISEPKDEMVEYDLAAEKPIAQEPIAKQTAKKEIKNTVKTKKQKKSRIATETAVTEPLKSNKGIFVQSGSFSTMQHANIQADEIRKYSENNQVTIQKANVNGKIAFRVVVGPFESKQKAALMVEHLDTSGHKSLIIKNK